jgi:hypothetical protein
MNDPAENKALPPFKLAVSAATAALCAGIVFNAVAGQDGRQRDVLSRLSDLEQHASLPVTIGVGAFDARPTTKSMVTIEQLAELAANESRREVREPVQREPARAMAEVDVRDVQEGLARLGYSPGPPDGVLGGRTRDAIRQFEQDRNLAQTGAISEELAREISRVLSGGG